MNDQLKEILYQVAAETLEKLAFIFAFPEDKRADIDFDSTVAASVSFAGPFSGILVLILSEETLPELAGNMLGIEEEIPLSQQHDALQELLNVICGNLLPAIAGRQEIFNIDVPIIVAKGENTEFSNGRNPTSLAKLELENGQVDLLLFIDDKDDKECLK